MAGLPDTTFSAGAAAMAPDVSLIAFWCTPAQGRSDVAGLPDTTSAGAAAMASSSLSGLSIHQMLDLDAEALAVKIDRQHSQTKKAVLVRGRDWGGCRQEEWEEGGGRGREGGEGRERGRLTGSSARRRRPCFFPAGVSMCAKDRVKREGVREGNGADVLRPSVPLTESPSSPLAALRAQRANH